MNTYPSYLVTGGFGLIGSAMVNALSDNPTKVLSRSQKHTERILRSDIAVIEKDLKDIIEKDLEGVDTIYHFASTVDNYSVLTNPYIDVETNIMGTIALLEACKNLVKKPTIVYLSTFFVYGHEYDRTKTPITEDAKTDPLALYPATKLCTESIIKLYAKLYEIPYRICRLTNVYGEHEDYTNKKKGAFNYLIMKAVKGETLSIYNNGNFYRDYIYVDDVIDALLFLEQKNILNDSFLIGYGKPVLFKDLIQHLLSLTGDKSSIEEIDSPAFHKIVGLENFVADTSKITNLGWTPKIDYKTGIAKIVARYKNIKEK